MVKRSMLQNVIIAGLLISMSFITPAYADGESATLGNIVARAGSLLQPVMDTNKITLAVSGDAALHGDVKNVEDRLVNLLSNAIVHAPSGTVIRVSFEGGENRLKLWVENSGISHSVKREVVDSLGNTFILETLSGKGTLYAISL